VNGQIHASVDLIQGKTPGDNVIGGLVGPGSDQDILDKRISIVRTRIRTSDLP